MLKGGPKFILKSTEILQEGEYDVSFGVNGVCPAVSEGGKYIDGGHIPGKKVSCSVIQTIFHVGVLQFF